MSLLKQLALMCLIGAGALAFLIWTAPIQAETVTVEVNCTKQAAPPIEYPVQTIFIGETMETLLWQQRLREQQLRIELLNEQIREWRRLNYGKPLSDR